MELYVANSFIFLITRLEVKIVDVSQLDAELLKCLFFIFSFSTADILKMGSEGSCSLQFSLLILPIVLKTHIVVRDCLFWNVCGSINCLKIVDNLTRLTVVDEINSRD